MTNNQLRHWQNIEDIRSHRAQEANERIKAEASARKVDSDIYWKPKEMELEEQRVAYEGQKAGASIASSVGQILKAINPLAILMG